MNSATSHRAIQAQREAQIRYDLMEDDSWEDGDPITEAFDEAQRDLALARTLFEQGQFDRAMNMVKESVQAGQHLATLLQDRID